MTNPVNFQTQLARFKLRNNDEWFEALPVISATMKKSAADLNGTYELVFPNLRGMALGYFGHFNDQELWFAHLPTQTMIRCMVGQINNISPNKGFTYTIQGRGLNGYFNDIKLTDSWTSKMGDFILCDPTFGAIPMNLPDISTWNAFTDDYDQFSFWDTARWGAQPAWCEVWDTELDATGDGATTLTTIGSTLYLYEVCEWRAKVSAASDTVLFGFSNAAGTQFARFALKAAAIYGETSDGVTTTTTATTDTFDQTTYHYYRVEWLNTGCRFFIDGVLEAEILTTQPTAQLSPFFSIAATTETLTLDHLKVIVPTTLYDAYTCNGKTIMDAVTEICKAGNSVASFTQYVDDDFDFHAYIANALPSGYAYGLNSTIYSARANSVISLETSEEAKDLYNVVKVSGGDQLTTVSAPTWTNQFKGDGTTTSFALGYRAKKPLTLLQVNGSTKTENTHFTCTYGSQHTIVQFNSVPALSAAINVRYDYFTPIIATSQNDASIAALGVTRVYAISDTSITSLARARSLSAALLAYYSDPRTVIKITIPLDPRQAIGTTVQVDAPFQGINDTTYEIIELEHEMSKGGWATKLTLANSEINTNAEILREILQQIKSLASRGEENQTATDEFVFRDNPTFAETLYMDTRYICDSFVLGHPENGIIGRASKVVSYFDDWTDWSTGASLVLSDESAPTYSWNGHSVKAVWTGYPANNMAITQGTALGDMSAVVGTASGVPVKGTLGLWIYRTPGTTIEQVQALIGTDILNLIRIDGAIYQGLPERDGWNYWLFSLPSGAQTGTVDWTNISYSAFQFKTISANGTLYFSYSAASESNVIGLNGLGTRYMQDTDLLATG